MLRIIRSSLHSDFGKLRMTRWKKREACRAESQAETRRQIRLRLDVTKRREISLPPGGRWILRSKRRKEPARVLFSSYQRLQNKATRALLQSPTAPALVATRSLLGSDSPPDCHSIPRSRFATSRREPLRVRLPYLLQYFGFREKRSGAVEPEPSPAGEGGSRRLTDEESKHWLTPENSYQEKAYASSIICYANSPPSPAGEGSGKAWSVIFFEKIVIKSQNSARRYVII